MRRLANEHEVVASDVNASGLARLVESFPSISPVSGDITNRNTLDELLRGGRPDALIHLAWYADPRDYLTSHANLDSLATTIRFVEEVLNVGCPKVIVGGSCAEYAPQATPLAESDPTSPNSLYGVTKCSASEILRVLGSEAGADVVWARLFHMHGPGEDERRLIPWVARQLRSEKPVELTDGTQVRDHLHIDDVASAFATLLRPGVRGVFNVCSGVPVTLRTVLETVADLTGGRALLQFGARPHTPGSPMYLAGDATKLRSLGWSPRFDLRDGLADGLRDLRII